MSYEVLGNMVTEARNLLDSIKGGAIRVMQTNFDSALAVWDARGQTAIAKHAADFQTITSPTTDQLPNISLTKNQGLIIAEGQTIPDGIIANSAVTMSQVENISQFPPERTANELTLLGEIESDIRKDFPDFNISKGSTYRNNFNVFRVQWDFGSSLPSWTIYPKYASISGSAVPVASILTMAAFVKLESGELKSGHEFLATGAVTGEWRFTKRLVNKDSSWFGGYISPHPIANSITGSMLIALPVVATGYLDHPRKLFSMPEIN